MYDLFNLHGFCIFLFMWDLCDSTSAHYPQMHFESADDIWDTKSTVYTHNTVQRLCSESHEIRILIHLLMQLHVCNLIIYNTFWYVIFEYLLEGFT